MLCHLDSQIKQIAVERYSPGMCPRYIQLRVMWTSEDTPERDDLSISLTGISEAVTFILECDPSITSMIYI